MKSGESVNGSVEVPLWEASQALIEALDAFFKEIEKPFPPNLIRDLSPIGSRYYLYRMLVDNRPKHAEAVEELKNISKLAKNLSKVLRKSNWLSLGMLYDVALTQKDTEPYPFIDKMASDLQKLASWADGGLITSKSQGGRPKLFSDDQLSRELAGLFKEATGKKAAPPYKDDDDGQYKGPFFRFFIIIFNALNESVKDPQLKRQIGERTLADIVFRSLRSRISRI